MTFTGKYASLHTMELFKKLNLTYVIVALIIGGAIFGYGYLNYLNKQNQLAQEQAKQILETSEKLAKEEALDNCINTAYKDYSNTWNLRVKNSGSTDGTLFRYQYEDIEETRAKAEELCVKKYK